MILLRLLLFSLRYAAEVGRSSLQVARDVLSPRPCIDPAFVSVPLRPCGELKLLLLSNLVTFTPGTVFVDVSDDGHWCVIHSLYGGDSEANAARLGRDVARLQDELDRLLP
jgi:multicomponent Na+:H+ antiporter subunit E